MMHGGGPARAGGRLLAAGEAVYRALLRAYPRDFRSRFGDEMALAFRDASRDALAAGGWRLTALWLRFFLDLLATAFRERLAAWRARAPHSSLHPTPVEVIPWEHCSRMSVTACARWSAGPGSLWSPH
jgi:hypothetical protein